MATQEEMDKKQVECAPECPGLDEKVLALPPEDKHLFRLSMLIPNSEIEYFVIKLGLSKHIWNEIALKYEYNHTTRGFIALYEWKKLKYRQYSRSSFQELSEALAHNYQTHFLCQLFKEEVIVYDIANIALQETPEDDVLKDLSEHVGNCAMHLGVELGLHMAAIEEILYRYPKDMFQQTFNVMKKWKTSSKVKTILMLMKVFQLVDARGLTFLREKYRMDAATTSRYESNYIKIAMVVLRVSPRAVRVQFDKEFHPDCLQGTLNKNDILLNDLKTKKRITQPQWNLLFSGTREPSSNDFDITLMICLLRNLIPIDIMDNRLPSATDTSVRADLSRIRFYRNLIVHRNLVTDTDFESYWNDVTPAILRLGGNSLKVECDDWYGRNIDAEQRDDGLKWIKSETRLALIEEELQEQSKQLAELVKQSKELAEQKSSITRTLLTHADLPHSMRTNDGTKELLSKGKFRSYENCIYLGGACNVGKSTLASILIGDDIPQHWNSTDGLHIYFGRNGIDLKTKKMVPFKQGSDVWSKVLLGQPDMTQEKYVQPQDSNKGNIITETHTIPQHKDNTLSTSTGPTPKDDENITDPLRQQSQILKVSKQNYTTIQENIKQEIRKGKYKIEIAPSDLIDFGGQRSFDMTHQLFIRHKGAFVLMFNGRINFSDPLEEYKQGETTESILTHWVNSILSYCTDDGDILPIIMFSATHSDYFNEVDRINRKAELIDGLRKIFKNHKRQHRIKYDDIFFINGKDKNDSEINRLKSKLVEVAFEQKSWGRRMPMAWVPLDLQMSEMRLINMNIISKEDLTTLNQRNEDLALTVEQMKDFLNDQHSLGKILYFDQHGLDKFIIVQPQSLVNILRSFITAKRFWPKDKKLRGILRTLTNTGKIDKQDLLELWSQDKFHQHMPNDDFKGFIIQVLVHLDILVQPTRDGQEQESQVQSYLVPCMVKRILPVTDFYVKSADKMICLSYTLLKSSIPAALSFKLIGAVINLWPLKETKDGICLYHQAAILCIDESNDLHLLVKDDKVVVYLINKGTKCFLSLNIASMVQECLTLTMTKVLEFYHKSFGKSLSTSEVSKAFELEVGEWCTSEGGCYISVPEAKEKIEWLCKNNKTHQTKYPLYWILDKRPLLNFNATHAY